MWSWLKKFLGDWAQKFLDFLKDVFLWLWEWIYITVNEFLKWFIGLVEEPLIKALEALGEHLPDGSMDKITALFDWLQFINEWVPIQYGISLFVAYYSIKLIILIIRWILRLIPGMGG